MLATHGLPGITFAVDDVEPARTPVLTCPPSRAIQGLLGSTRGPGFAPIEACWSVTAPCMADVEVHPLLAAVHRAFAEHRPLVLSPDVLWVTIVQGLAQHVRRTPEAFRTLLVRHEGRRTIQLQRTDITGDSPENPWEEVIAGFAAGVCREAGPLAGQFVADFSTTGPVERVVSEVILLDLFEPYFGYELRCICGIPTITLEGTPGDWRRLRDKVELLAPFGLDWWLSELRPICEQFARAAAGDVDRAHWTRMYKPEATYGQTVMTGWLGMLFPYLRGEGGRNPLLDAATQQAIVLWQRDGASSRGRRSAPFREPPGVTESSLPVGLSLVPFTILDIEAGTERAMQLVAGAMAVTHDPTTGALRPTLGWAVRGEPPVISDRARMATVLDALPGHAASPAASHDGFPPYELLRDDLWEDDLWQFYRTYHGASLHPAPENWLERLWPWVRRSPPRATYTILPLAQWTARDSLDQDGEGAKHFCFGMLADQTELLIRLGAWVSRGRGEVSVGQRRGAPVPDTGATVARSFAEFLGQAIANPEPFFRAPGFVPLHPADGARLPTGG